MKNNVSLPAIKLSILVSEKIDNKVGIRNDLRLKVYIDFAVTR